MMSVLMESKQPQWKDFPSVYLTVAELSLAPSSSSVEEGDMQIYLLESLEKHCPRLAFSEAGKTSQSHNKTGKVRGKYMHPSTHYWCFATVDFDSRKKGKILQALLDSILSLLLSHGKHNEDVTQVNRPIFDNGLLSIYTNVIIIKATNVIECRV